MISLTKVKELLGIVTTDYDAQINLMIPIVESDVKRILNHRFDEKLWCKYYAGSNEIHELTGLSVKGLLLDNDLVEGRVVEGIGIPDDTYITGYDELTMTATLSNPATADGTYIKTSIEIGQWFPIAKMIWFKISKLNTNEDWKRVQSQTMGPVSISFIDTVDAKTGYPIDLIKDLGVGYYRV